jgi:hypothetical protein
VLGRQLQPIHYTLTTPLNKRQDVRHLVETIRQFALDLPFKEVGEIKEFMGKNTDWQKKDDPDRWLKIQSVGHITEGRDRYMVKPNHIIAFATLPGDGCEPANFGFCQYPTPKLQGWRWHSFCKTQYASDPRCGGVENFVRCHLCVIQLLDFIKQTGLTTIKVVDESDYWDHRDVKKLAQTVGEWNELVAGFVSEQRNAEGKIVHAPITGFPHFEHLEAKGLDRIAELKRKLGEK